MELAEDGKGENPIIPRIRSLFTAFLYIAFGLYFKRRAKAEIMKICPGGKSHMLGGNRKRNILTFEEDFYLMFFWCAVRISDDLVVFLILAYHEILGKVLPFFEIWQIVAQIKLKGFISVGNLMSKYKQSA